MATEVVRFSPDLDGSALTQAQRELLDPEGAMATLRAQLRKFAIPTLCDEENNRLVFQDGDRVFEYDPRTGLARSHHTVNQEGKITGTSICVYRYGETRTLWGRLLVVPITRYDCRADGLESYWQGEVVYRGGAGRSMSLRRILYPDDDRLGAMREAAFESRARVQALLTNQTPTIA